MIEGHGDDAYKYGGKVRMDFSSNVYMHAPHEGLFQELSGKVGVVTRYPEPAPFSLEARLAEELSVSPDEVCATAGATEAIYLVAQTWAGKHSAVWMPTFSEYADACRLHGHRISSLFDLERIPAEVQLVWCCNPNNPTGAVIPKDQLKAYLTARPDVLFVVDQSYEDFTQCPVLSAHEAVCYPNLLQIHSLTKHFSVPGLRLGYLTGPAGLLQEVRLRRMPWSVSPLAVEAAFYLLDHVGEYEAVIPFLLAERARVAAALQRLGGMEVWPSETHFLLVQLRTGKAAALKDYLVREHGILIRDASNFTGLDERFFRIAVQGREENDALINAIGEWMFL